MKPVLIVWEDASAESGPWVHADEAGSMPIKVFHQVGWLLSMTSTEVVLSQAIEPDGKGLMAARERIPAGMIRSIVELTPGEPVKLPRRKSVRKAKE